MNQASDIFAKSVGRLVVTLIVFVLLPGLLGLFSRGRLGTAPVENDVGSGATPAEDDSLLSAAARCLAATGC